MLHFIVVRARTEKRYEGAKFTDCSQKDVGWLAKADADADSLRE